ncbi:MAG: hypothetical protein ACI95X_002817 [Paraglaciecola sp.]|jgi:hypothetical protein
MNNRDWVNTLLAKALRPVMIPSHSCYTFFAHYNPLFCLYLQHLDFSGEKALAVP